MKQRWLTGAIVSCLLLTVAALLLTIAACNKGGKPPPVIDDEPGPPVFADVTATSGVTFTYNNGEAKGHMGILESLGGGVALIDYDGDGLLDVFVTAGGWFDRANSDYHLLDAKTKQPVIDPKTKEPRRDADKLKKEPPGIHGYPCALYKNLGTGKFKDVTKEVGLDKLAGGKPWFYSHGAAVADFDRDGWPDLLVTGWGGVALFRNVPVDPTDPKKGRQLLDVTADVGLDKGITWTTSAAFGDLDRDGWPDLYLCQYADWSWHNHPLCTYDGKTRDVCPPKQFAGLKHLVFRNTAKADVLATALGSITCPHTSVADCCLSAWLAGSPGIPTAFRRSPATTTGKRLFVNVSDEAGLKPGGANASKGLGVLLVDLDGDGYPEVYVANDTVPKFLYMNLSSPGRIRFEEMAMRTGCAVDESGGPQGSMGLAVGDYDGSGTPALWVTNYENEQHALYQPFIKGNYRTNPEAVVSFQFQTQSAGLAAAGQREVGWGTAFIDFDLSGWEGLWVSNGHAIRFPTATGVTRKQKARLKRNLGKGRFKDVSGEIGSYNDKAHVGRGVGFGDLDNDGRIDLVLNHTNEPVSILRGIGGQGRHWLGVQLLGADHADVVGAKATLEVNGRKLTRFVFGGGSYLSSADRRLLFGLAESTNPGKLTVTWPNGKQQHFSGLASDRYHRIIQGQDKPLPYPK
jgi:hypothetical protein